MSREQGAEAELRAELKLWELKFNTSRPTQDLTYDLIAEKNGKTIRIQVKSTTRLNTKNNHDQYDLTCRRGYGGKQRYKLGDFDVLLAYVQPEDAWYVVPLKEIRGETLALYPHRTDTEGQYEQYKERWDLLSNHQDHDSRGCGCGDGETAATPW